MSRWLTALLAWCFVFIVVTDRTSITPARSRSFAAHATRTAVLVAILVGLAYSTQSQAGDPLPTGAQVRVVITGIDGDWHTGEVRSIEGCRMVFLVKATRDGYTSVMINAVQRLQLLQHGSWQEVLVAGVLNSELPKCRELGAD